MSVNNQTISGYQPIVINPGDMEDIPPPLRDATASSFGRQRPKKIELGLRKVLVNDEVFELEISAELVFSGTDFEVRRPAKADELTLDVKKLQLKKDAKGVVKLKYEANLQQDADVHIVVKPGSGTTVGHDPYEVSVLKLDKPAKP